MPEPIRKAVIAAFMIIFAGTYLGLVWSICQSAAKGIKIDWQFTAWLLLIAGCVAMLAQLALASLLRNNDIPIQAKAKFNDAPDKSVIKPIIVITPPTRTPLIERREQTMLAGVVLTVLLGGLLVRFFARRRNRQS